MSEHIGRLQSIGFGPETTSGTAVSAAAWFPKVQGTFSPIFEKAQDTSAYGNIDEVADSQTVKNMTEVNFGGSVTDNRIGYLFRSTMGKAEAVFITTLASVTGGTPARGDVVTSVSPTAFTGKIRKILTIGGATYYAISTTSGTLGSGATDFTNGTWTATVTKTAYAAVKGWLFTRLDSNDHPSVTAYGSDPVGDERAAYCMVDTFEIEAKVKEYVTFKVKLLGKKLESASAQSPAYVTENFMLAKHATVKFAADEAALNAASAGSLQRFKLNIAKNVTDVQAFGSTDVEKLKNQTFSLKGDFDAMYADTVYRDYVANSTKKASRFSLVNTEATAIYTDGTPAKNIYPSIYIDMASVAFEEWKRSDANNDLVSQTAGFVGESSRSTGMTLEILLLNTNSTGYA